MIASLFPGMSCGIQWMRIFMQMQLLDGLIVLLQKSKLAWLLVSDHLDITEVLNCSCMINCIESVVNRPVYR